MAEVALSTMWSQGRFQRMRDFAAAARRLGFDGIEINYVIPPEGVDELIDSGEIAVTSLHSPTPRVKTRDGRWSEGLNLASTDKEERGLAVELGRRTLQYAAKAGARYVVFHLGGVGSDDFEEERALRHLYREGLREGDEVAGLRRRCRERRTEGVVPHFEAARRSLAALAEEAAPLGVAVGLENRYHYHEIPTVDEVHELLAPYPRELVGYWHDVGHAEVLHRLGLADGYRWLSELGDRCLGTHVHDVDGVRDHRAPGRGDVDWSYIAEGLPPEAPRVFEISQQTPENQVAASIPFLRRRGVLS
ncbi:MAG: sugar phosphate isomerase/epimerase [Chloroflexi bacterium]|nr:sugar phosphate isomerase/epimerase [Chloroflexota bacterium]